MNNKLLPYLDFLFYVPPFNFIPVLKCCVLLFQKKIRICENKAFL